MKISDLLLFVLTTSVLISILFVAYFIISTDYSDDSFSTLEFSNPDLLPSSAQTDSTKSFEYSVDSYEHKLNNYTVQSSLELYRLYDATEGIYDCLADFRRKIYLHYTNESPVRYIWNNNTNNIVKDLVIEPNYAELINWSHYKASASAYNEFGEGQFLLYFENNNTLFYTLLIDGTTNNTYLNQTYIGTLSDAEDVGIFIEYKREQLFISVNDELFYSFPFVESEGQFGFESRNAYYKFGLTVYRDEPIEIPVLGNVMNYEISLNYYYNLLRSARNDLSKSYNFVRQYNSREDTTVIPRNCNSFPCTYTFTSGQSLVLENQTNVSDYIVNLPWNNLTLPFWHISQETVEIPWYYFNISGTHPALSTDASISLIFDEDLALTLTNKSITIFYQEENNIHIQQVPYDNTTFRIYVKNTTIEIESSAGPVSINIPFQLYNKTLQLYTINSISTISELVLEKYSCESYSFCKITILPSATRRFTNEVIENLGEATTVNSISSFRKSISSIQEEQIDVPEQVINSIPDTINSFNGAQALIKNSSNFSFSFRTEYLDGKGLISLLFRDLNDSVVFNVTHDFFQGKMFVNGRSTQLISNPLGWRRISLSYKDGNMTAYFNGTQIRSFKHPGPLDGYFSIESYDTHNELSDLYLQRDEFSRNLPLLEDPCRLRLVYSEVLRNEDFSLEPQDSKIFTDSFTLDRFFDYGKVNVDLYGSSQMNNTPLHIHYWLVRE